jgi:transposase-like protein
MDVMPKKFPPEFKRDVVTVARRGDLTVAEVAADFDISVESVRRWMRQADIDDGVVGGLTMVCTGFCAVGMVGSRARDEEVIECRGVTRLSFVARCWI